jgi:HTH-type transcriptional regulator, glycine betaine synthesis regulator
MTSIPSKARQEMIAIGGRLCQLLGLPRSTGQIYGLLYLSLKPLSLDDIVAMLGISKASASTGTRHLLYWGAIRQTWVPGERRDHFEIVEDVGQWIRGIYQEYVKPRLNSSKQRLDSLQAYLEEEHKMAVLTADEYKLCCERLRNLQRVRHKLQSLSPLAERML